MTATDSAAGHHFLSCDWGTSTFRLRLVDTATGGITAGSRGSEGISATHAAWQAGGATDRWRHFRRVIEQHLAPLARQHPGAIRGAPLVISGMATSSIGMRELPYATLPLAIDGSNLQVERVETSSEFGHGVVLISGVRSADDIMRGEETQLVGASAEPGDSGRGAQTLIFPGTHSKHIHVEGRNAVRFETYMTGEFFELLSRKSILAHSVSPASPDRSEAPDHSSSDTPENRAAFEAGVRDGSQQNMLHACFRVRTRGVLAHLPPNENLQYLSGLLIGAELRELKADVPLTLVGSGPLLTAYRRALRILGDRAEVRVLDADECLIAGQIAIARRAGLLSSIAPHL